MTPHQLSDNQQGLLGEKLKRSRHEAAPGSSLLTAFKPGAASALEVQEGIVGNTGT